MRVIQPASLAPDPRRRLLAAAGTLLAIGAIAVLLVLSQRLPGSSVGLMAAAAALGLGVGLAWLVRGLRTTPWHRAARELVQLLEPTFDDAYTLIVGPRLPGVGEGLSGLLVGPAGIRALTIRRWDGRYRVRGRAWEFDAGGRGWIACRTNPSFDALRLRDQVARWADTVGAGHLPMASAVVLPWSRSRVVLEEPDDEIVTSDNAPWWANRIGRTQRLDAGWAGRFVQAVLDAGEEAAGARPRPSAEEPGSS